MKENKKLSDSKIEQEKRLRKAEKQKEYEDLLKNMAENLDFAKRENERRFRNKMEAGEGLVEQIREQKSQNKLVNKAEFDEENNVFSTIFLNQEQKKRSSNKFFSHEIPFSTIPKNQT